MSEAAIAFTRSIKDSQELEYGSSNYWPLVSVVNKDRGYFELEKENPQTMIPSGGMVEIWKVSRYHSITKETLVHVHTKLTAGAHEQLLSLAEQNPEFNQDLIDKLSDEFRNQELGFGVIVTWDKGEFPNIGELSIKHYGQKKFRDAEMGVTRWGSGPRCLSGLEMKPLPAILSNMRERSGGNTGRGCQAGFKSRP